MIVLFAGAGASKAVDSNQYPTTIEFFERLPDEIRQAKPFDAVLTYLKAQQHSDIIDIEQVLWALTEWVEFEGTMTDVRRVPGWLLEENRIANITDQNTDWRAPINVASSLAKTVKTLISGINKHVYEWYSPLPTQKQLDRSWLPLLRGLLQIDPRVEVFTTNYDLVLEQAVHTAQLPIDTGRIGGVQPILDVGLWDPRDSSRNGKGLLTKLHGSVDWSRGPNAIHVGTPTFRGTHKDHVIIYPGYKGVPSEAPFSLFHRHFQRCVSDAVAFVFVGFAFRDPYLNGILRERVPSMAEVVIIDPNSTSECPFREGAVTHIERGFDLGSGKEAVNVLKRLGS